MARLFGVNISDDKKIEFALTMLYGIGWTRASDIVKQSGVTAASRIGQLKEEELKKITDLIDHAFKIEGELREEEGENIKRLKDISSYRGVRHARGLPARGQRTRSNARTRRGKRRTVGSLTKEAWAKLEGNKPAATPTK